MKIIDRATTSLDELRELEEYLFQRYEDKMHVNNDLDRTLVSFQANRKENGHRWWKYKEGFSASLMRYIFKRTRISHGTVLDPFAGSGTLLFTASESGLNAEGIELLPSSSEVIEVRALLNSIDKVGLAKQLRTVAKCRRWVDADPATQFPHLRITEGAFPSEAEMRIGQFLTMSRKHRDPVLQRVLRFAALCILESVSYTRKDGQYLRWDYRAGRSNGGKRFDKGRILDFNEAISSKLNEIADDLDGGLMLFQESHQMGPPGGIQLHRGSCLDVLPQLRAENYNGIVTSPPYCNRYDYTRTYALELAMLGVTDDELKELRQAMLTCTVENREKSDLYDKFDRDTLQKALRSFDTQALLQRILSYLDQCRQQGTLNNNGIPRMVRNYFLEMAFVISECARVLKAGAPFVMVNDNVRYQGIHIPVDLILSEFAVGAGLTVDAIWVLPKGKGNSSQQMGRHGRQEIRKCVYVWRKPIG